MLVLILDWTSISDWISTGCMEWLNKLILLPFNILPEKLVYILNIMRIWGIRFNNSYCSSNKPFLTLPGSRAVNDWLPRLVSTSNLLREAGFSPEQVFMPQVLITVPHSVSGSKQSLFPPSMCWCFQAPEGESQPSTEVDLFISTEKIMVLNTDLKVITSSQSMLQWMNVTIEGRPTKV